MQEVEPMATSGPQSSSSEFSGFAELEKVGWTSEQGVAGYVELFSSASDLAIPSLVGKLEPPSRVLDLCCGQGNVTEALCKAGHTVVGVDFSPAMLARAKLRTPEAKFVEANAQALPFDEKTFDAVVCNFGISHIPDQQRALCEVARVLKPAGRLAMTSWCGPASSVAFQIFYSSVQRNGDPSVEMPEGPNFHFFDDKAASAALLSNANMMLTGHEQIDCYWDLDRPDMLADIFERGAPRGGTLMRRQPEDARRAIRNAVADQVKERCARAESFRVPVPATIVTATGS
jgi:SAM-dependent methyltransferase